MSLLIELSSEPKQNSQKTMTEHDTTVWRKNITIDDITIGEIELFSRCFEWVEKKCAFPWGSQGRNKARREGYDLRKRSFLAP